MSWHRALIAWLARWLPRSPLVVRGRTRDRMLALTFDDGPDALTPRYLELLARHHVHATFFVLGGLCERRPWLVDQMLRDGHEVCSHGYSHRRFPRLDARALDDELRRTAAFLTGSAGARRVRPPHGQLSARSLARCARAGFATVLWSLDSGDWQLQSPTAIAERLDPSRVRPGDIVLLHEGQDWTLAALEIALARLTAAGWAFGTLGEVLAR